MSDLESNTVSLRDYLDARFDAIDVRFDAIDSRFDSVNPRFDGVDKRLDKLEAQLGNLEVAVEATPKPSPALTAHTAFLSLPSG